MGAVYEAHDPVIERRVAIKVVHTDLLASEEREAYLDRFRQEARAAGRCNHPAIVSIFDFAMHEGNPFLAMEFVDGVGLDRALAQGERFAPHAAAHIVLQLLEALGSAHAVGIVHRDVKPANILLLGGGRMKVTDFGIARLDNSGLTVHGMAIGTPRYMSPEQWLGGEVDARSDLFSTAVLLQELLTGDRPFPKLRVEEIGGTISDTMHGDDDKVVAVAGPAVRAVIHRALARRPEDRFESAAAMAASLRAAMDKAEAPALEPAAEIDKTLTSVRVRSRAPAGPDASGLTLEPALLTSIERQLAQHLGPIATYLVRSTLKCSESVEGLCDALAQRIDRPEERTKFLTSALYAARETSGSRGSSGGSAPAATGLSPGKATGEGAGAVAETVLSDSLPPTDQEIEQVRRALAELVGPIAKVLVNRAIPKVRSSRDLWDLLAAHIESPTERASFLARRLHS
jgi:serine/threonine protein kinase